MQTTVASTRHKLRHQSSVRGALRFLSWQEFRQEQHALDEADTAFDTAKGVLGQRVPQEAPDALVHFADSLFGVVPRRDAHTARHEERVLRSEVGQRRGCSGYSRRLENRLRRQPSRPLHMRCVRSAYQERVKMDKVGLNQIP